ncbi:MarR family winged helix-turn-helix transcriptional regulator [Streptomyces chartreusis]|uniref:MarR family winged helix-turn-helix transcriptional regulator n=1 Tax=Streptomyces chartreusis TaxID=1969 RepID=UPI00362FFD84
MTRAPYSGVLADGIAHQLRRATQAVNASWQQHGSDLTAAQFAVLQVLDERESADQKTLGSLAAVDPSTLTPLLDRLQARGLITKATDPRNRRRHLVALTTHGREQAARGRIQAEETNRQVEELLGRERFFILVTLLRELGDAALIRGLERS